MYKLKKLTNKLTSLMAITLVFGVSSACYGSERQATLYQNGETEIQYYSSPMPNSDLKKTAKHEIRIDPVQNESIWVFQVNIGLNTDYDHDGHYSNFTISLDIDTTAVAPTVYAVLYMSLAGGPWTEYAVTGNFTLNGSGSGDTYTIDASLDSGYPSGYYDQQIEIYGAYSHELLLSYGPNNSQKLQGLPFESSAHDNSFSLNPDITLSFSGTGSLGLPLLLSLVCVIVCRRAQFNKKTITNQTVFSTPNDGSDSITSAH